jgi:glutamate 5-kinase
VSGLEVDVITRIAAGEVTGTLLTADREVLVSRKQWLSALPSMGQLTLDDGAARVLKSAGRSLLPVGVTRVTGQFTRGEMVSCIDQSGLEICRGLVNYNHDETSAILGRSSSEIGTILGYLGDKELIHRDNLVLSF